MRSAPARNGLDASACRARLCSAVCDARGGPPPSRPVPLRPPEDPAIDGVHPCLQPRPATPRCRELRLRPLYFDARRSRRSPRRTEAPVPETGLAFSFELWDGIQRYEALAGATEEAGTSHGQISPELEAIETPDATPEEISAARDEVASRAERRRPTCPIVVNDSVLRVIAAFQGPALHDKIAAGLSRSAATSP